MKNNKVFLGGTCANSTWRDVIIPLLSVDYFNPVVEDWTPACQEVERVQKMVDCNIHLYVITREMEGVFSIAEVMDSVNMDNKITILHVIPEGFSDSQLRSLSAVVGMVLDNGGIAYTDSNIHRTAGLINYGFDE